MEIPLYRDGQWTTCPNPVPDDDHGDFDEALNRAGYGEVCRFHPGGDERTMCITVWGDGADPSRPGQKAAPGSPKYLLDIELGGTTEVVAVAGIVDVMNLLAAWTPVVQVGHVCDEAAERWKKENGF